MYSPWSVYHSTACVGHLCNKMNVPANFAPNSKDFQVRDFAKKLSLTSFSLFYTTCVVMPITIYGYRIQFIGYRANTGTQSVVATWQCISNKSLLVIAYPEVSLGLRLDHSYMYGLILELSELHTCTHYPIIAMKCWRPSLHAYSCMCILMTVTSCSNLASITVLMNNSSHISTM